MSSTHKTLTVLALAVGFAAVSGIACARPRPEANDPERRAALTTMDEAIARQDLGTAAQAWKQARELGMRARSWQGPAEAAEATLRFAAVADNTREAVPAARELFLVALFRARGEGSVDGALRAAEGFARLGDRDAATLALRLADGVAVRSGDIQAPSRVRLAGERLLRPATDLTRAAVPGT
jgi:hypothetical protein